MTEVMSERMENAPVKTVFDPADREEMIDFMHADEMIALLKAKVKLRNPPE